MTATDEAATQVTDSKHRIPVWIELPLVILVAVLLAFVVKTFLVQIFYIPSGSMENTLLVGDRVAVNRLAYRTGQPQRGDVVVFDGIDSFVPASQAPESEGPVKDLVTESAGRSALCPRRTRSS